MEIKDAQKRVDELIKIYGGYWQPLSMMARLTEENGELARAMNVKFGEKKSKKGEIPKDIEKELSDILFTILAISNSQNIDLEKEFREKIAKDFERLKGVYHNDNINT
jgi:NTP pyrophosphatase (non-canonical NTP hydrolase)